MANKSHNNYYIVQANTFVRGVRRNLSKQQALTYRFLTSMIKSDDDPRQVYSFTADYMRKSLNMTDSGTNYDDLKAALKHLRDNSFWMDKGNGRKELVATLEKVEIDETDGKIYVSFHESIHPYLFYLKSNYTQYRFGVARAFRHQYSCDLYEYLLSYFGERNHLETELTISLDKLKERLSYEYDRWPDIRRFVLDRALDDINTFTDDIRVQYEPVKTGKKVIEVKFTLTSPTDDDAYFSSLAESHENHKSKKRVKKNLEDLPWG